jgi:predicted Kef-type K+ transport protein
MTQYATDLAGIALVASATSLALGLLARATGLSPAIGYVLAGVVVGPLAASVRKIAVGA